MKKGNQNEYFSYYQIKSFIDVLAIQLIKLDNNFLFKIEDIRKDKELESIRTIIIKGFINCSIYSTEEVFIKLINEQKMANNNLFGQYNEGKDIEK